MFVYAFFNNYDNSAANNMGVVQLVVLVGDSVVCLQGSVRPSVIRMMHVGNGPVPAG